MFSVLLMAIVGVVLGAAVGAAAADAVSRCPSVHIGRSILRLEGDSDNYNVRIA